MKTNTELTPLEVAHAKATRIGKLFEKRGVVLSRAQQLEAYAFIEGAANWHVLSAELKAEPPVGTLVTTAYADGTRSTWRTALVHLRESGQSWVYSPMADHPLSASNVLQVNENMSLIEPLFVAPECMHVAFVDGVLGMIVEQEFYSEESDGSQTSTEGTEACVNRLTKHLLPMLEPVLSSIPGSRAAIVAAQDVVWRGRPACWVFLPLTACTRVDVQLAISIHQDFAYN